MRKNIFVLKEKEVNEMSCKMMGALKAAGAGAILGIAVGSILGVIAAPCGKKKKRHGKLSRMGGTVRAVGVAMQNLADLLH